MKASCRMFVIGAVGVGAYFSATAAPLLSQDSLSTIIRAKVAQQAAADLIAAGVTRRPPTADQLSTRREPLLGSYGVVLWRVSLPSLSHWKSYELVEYRGQVFQLGGFPSPELSLFASALASPAGGAMSPTAVGDLLFRVSDEMGEGLIRAQSADEGSVELLKAWRAAHPSATTADSVVSLSSGATAVIISGFASRSFTGDSTLWAPITGAFIFSASGQLLAWKLHEGEVFGLRKPSR